MRPSPGDAPASRFPGDIRTSPHGLKQEYTPDHKDSGFPGSSVKTALPVEFHKDIAAVCQGQGLSAQKPVAQVLMIIKLLTQIQLKIRAALPDLRLHAFQKLSVFIWIAPPGEMGGGRSLRGSPGLAAETARAMLSLRSLAPSSTPGRICACISMIFFLSIPCKNLTCSHGLRIAFHIFHKILYHSIKINSRFFRLKQVLNVCLKQV